MKKQPENGFKSKKRATASSMRLALENRLLFDGAVVATAQAVDDKAGQDQDASTNQADAAVDNGKDSGQPPSALGNLFNFDYQERQPATITQVVSAGIQGAPNLLIVDPRAEGVNQLLQRPPANTDIRVLNTNRDGYQQINEILQDRDNTFNLHIQTADLNGTTWLGSSKINQTIAANDSHTFMDWGNELAVNAKITFHGNQVQTGNSWLDQVQALTGGQVNWVRNDILHTPNDDQILIDHAPITRPIDHTPTELVFVDTTVKGYQALLKDIDPTATVILLDPSKNGVEQIAQIVSTYDNVDALHIISHGSEGELKIGNGVLNQANMQGEYADELATIGQHLSQNADILIYGCDFGKGDIGLRATNLLAALTSADIADSTDDTGSAHLGGNWVLERTTGVIESGQVLSAAGMAAFSGLMDTPVPTVTLSGTSDVSIGSNFTFTATFDNTASSGVGYAPYIDLKLPATGKDGNDGVNFVSATYLGQPVTATVLTFDGSGNATHPIAKNGSGAALIITGTPGDKLVVLELPFGSVTATQPTIPVVITASLSNLADVANDTTKDLSISARAGFRFGQDALDNPGSDPIIQGATQTFNVHPTLVTMTQTFDGPENDTTTGPNYVRHLTTTTTPATGQTLTDFDVTQALPNTIFVKAINTNGGTITSITKGDGSVITNPAQITAALSAGTFLQSYTVRYATLNAAKDTVVDFYVPNTDSAGNPILNATSGDDRTITVAAATGSGSWTPVDSRDAVTPISMSTNKGVAIQFDAKSIAVQKSVAIQNNAGVAGTSPGDKMEYTLKVEVSDYFAFGKNGSGAGSWLVNDVLGDGQTWDNSFVPTLTYTDTTGSHSVTLIRGTNFTVGNAAGNDSGGKAADGKTYLQFDLASALTRLQGDLHGDALLNGASTVTINLRSTIDDNYTTSYSQSILNEGDSISNNVTTDGTLLNPALTLTGQNEADTSAVTSTIAANQVVTSIVGVNGSLGSPTQLKPGDLVTIKVKYDLATGDYENFKLKSFLPLPVLTTNDSNADGTPGDAWTQDSSPSGLPALGQWEYGAGHNAGLVTGGVAADPTANSLTFDFQNGTNTGNETKTAEILYTIKVSDQVFADELFLTLLAQAVQNDTILSTSITSEALVNIKIAEPEVTIKTGVVKVSNPGATITGTTGTWEAAGTGGGSTPFSGTITSASAVDGNLTNFDGGDTIRLATAVENSGGSAAFDVKTTIGAPPAGLSFVGGNLGSANLKVALGDGTLLILGTDYNVVGNEVTFLDNGGNGTLGFGRDENGAAVNDGKNVVVITYDVTSSNTVNASQNFTTSATLTNYASNNGGPDFSIDDLTDSATEVAAAPSVVKVFKGGTIDDADSNSPSTTGANVVIGESMVYDIKVTLPEGNTQNLRLDDLVPAGMKLDTSFNGTGYELITTSAASNGSLSANFNGAVTVNSITGQSGILGNDGIDGRLTFSATSTNTADNVAGNDTFVVRVRLIADDVIGNQAGTNLSTPAQLVFSDTDGTSGSGPAADQTVASVGNPTITVREPALTITKTVDTPSGVDEGDTVQYTITITNPLGGNNVNAYDLIYGDTFPSELSSINIVSAVKGATNIAGSFQVVGNTVQTLGGTAGNAGVNLDLAPGETITLVVSGVANSTVAAVPNFDSPSEVRWSSIDSANNLPASQDPNERTGVDGVGSGLNNYAAQDGAPVNVQTVASLTHIGGLPDTAAPAPTTAPENVAIGEIVRYRAVVRIPEGSIANYNIQANLPAGLSYINDGTTKVGFVYDSAGGSVSSSIGGSLITGGTLKITGNETAPEAGNIPANLSNGPNAVLAGSQIDTSNTQAPIFNFGNITNNENDVGSEFVVVEFNARVDNIAANTTADSFNVNFTARTGTSVLVTSNTVVENVVEPTITNLTKTVTTFDPAINSTTGRATMTLNFTNSGDGAANDVNLADSVTGGTNYSISSVTIGGISYTLGTLPSGVTASTTGGISVDFTQLAAGTSVSVVYTVDVPSANPIASTDAVVTYSGLPETFTTFAGSNVDLLDGSINGERDSSGGATAPNNYKDADGAGFGVVNGTLWDDTNNANGTPDVGETRLDGQVVTLEWAGADGNLATTGDNLTFTTTTDINGDYHFGALPAGNYRITGDNAGGTITVGGEPLKPRFDSDNTTPFGTINLALGEGATGMGDIGYVQKNDPPVNTLPGLQTFNEDDTLQPISGISITDPDAGTSIMTTQLSVLHGTLQVSLAGGATISAGANSSGTLTVSGTQVQINAALASLKYSPTPNYNGNDTLTVLTNDKGNTGDANNDGIPGTVQDELTDTDTVAITVTAVDDPFTDADEVASTPEDTVKNGNVLIGTTSVDGLVTVVSFTVAGDPTVYTFGQTANIPNVGTLVINQDGAYTFTPLPDFNGPVPVATYTLSDGLGPTETSTLTITVDPLVDIKADTGSTPEDTPITLDVLANDGFDDPAAVITAINGQAIADGGPAITVPKGSVKLIGGQLEFTPDPDFNGTVPTFTYTVTAGGVTETADVDITVTPVPDIAPDLDTTPEDTPITLDVLANDGFDDPAAVITAINGQAIADGGPAITVPKGSVKLIGGQLEFTPDPDFNGTVPTFTYTVTSGSVTETADVDITVTPLTDINPDIGTTPEDTPITLDVLANDGFDDPAAVITAINGQAIADGGPAITVPKGSVKLIGGQLEFTPDPDFNGTVPTFTYTVTAGGVTETADVDITVTPVPDIAPDLDTTPEDTPITLDVLANDGFDDPAAVITAINGQAIADGGPAITVPKGSVKLIGGQLEFTPDPDFNGTVPTFTYTVTSGSVTETADVDITVTPLTDINPDIGTTPEDTPITLDVLANDGFDDPAAVITAINGQAIADGGPAITVPKGSVKLIGGQLEFTPDPDFNGTVPTFTYTVTAGGVTETADVDITVTPVPDIAPDLDTTPEDTPITLDVLANDGFDDPAAVITAINGQAIADGGPAITVPKGSVKLIGGQLEFTPDPDFNGTVPTFTYTVTAGGVTETADVDITVDPVNDPFTDADEVVSTPEDTVKNGNVLIGTTSVDGLVTVVSFTVAGDPTVYTFGQTANIPNVGTLVINQDGAYTFTPLPDFNGPVPVATYTLSDGLGPTETSTLTITVDPLVDIKADTGSTPEDTPITLDVLANDGFDDPAAVITAINGQAIADGGPAVIVPNGSVQLVGGKLVFTPDSDFNGKVPTFTYTVTAGNVTETANVDIIVTPLEDIKPDIGTTPEDTPITLDVLANDGFAPDAVITAINGQAIADGGPAISVPNGSVRLIDGKLVFTPEPDFNGPVPTFTYTVTSGGVTEVGNVDITVTPVNDPPVAIDDGTVKTVPDQPVKGNVLSNDKDPDNDILKVTQFTVAGLPGVFPAGSTATIPGVGVLVIKENGDFTFTPKPGYEGPVPKVTYVITDGNETDTATLSFADVPGPINNIGSIIMLANPTPPFPSTPLGGSFALLEDEDLQPPIDRNELYGFSRQSLFGNLHDCHLYLTISLRNQVVLEMQPYSFSVPPETFCHCNPNEMLEYVATKPDGTPLPNWLHFDPKKLKFTGVPPRDSMNTVVMLTAKDRYGHEAHSTFNVTVNKERDYSGTGHHKWVVKRGHQSQSPDKISQNEHSRAVTAGKSSFIEQVNNSGKLSRLMESRSLLNSLSKLT